MMVSPYTLLIFTYLSPLLALQQREPQCCDHHGAPLLNHHVCIVVPELPLPVYWMMSETLIDAFTALGAATITELTDREMMVRLGVKNSEESAESCSFLLLLGNPSMRAMRRLGERLGERFALSSHRATTTAVVFETEPFSSFCSYMAEHDGNVELECDDTPDNDCSACVAPRFAPFASFDAVWTYSPSNAREIRRGLDTEREDFPPVFVVPPSYAPSYDYRDRRRRRWESGWNSRGNDDGRSGDNGEIEADDGDDQDEAVEAPAVLVGTLNAYRREYLRVAGLTVRTWGGDNHKDADAGTANNNRIIDSEGGGAVDVVHVSGAWNHTAWRSRVVLHGHHGRRVAVNLHRSPKTAAAEFFRLAPLLSSGLRVVSQRCDHDDEAALRGLVTFADGGLDFARAVRGPRHTGRVGGEREAEGEGGGNGNGDEAVYKNGNRLFKKRRTADATADAQVEEFRERFNLTRSMAAAIKGHRALRLRSGNLGSGSSAPWAPPCVGDGDHGGDGLDEDGTMDACMGGAFGI